MPLVPAAVAGSGIVLHVLPPGGAGFGATMAVVGSGIVLLVLPTIKSPVPPVFTIGAAFIVGATIGGGFGATM